MNVIALPPVQKFLRQLDGRTYGRSVRAINLLIEYGHALAMPYAKPVGKGLFELRVEGAASVRMLYGFCNGTAVIAFGHKKQRPALGSDAIALARERLARYCQ